MRLRLGVFALCACLLLLAGGIAHAAKPRTASFRVTLTATLTTQWTYTQSVDEGECARTTRGSGTMQLRLSGARAAAVRAVALRGGKVRFTGRIARLGGTVVRSASSTATTTGGRECDRRPMANRCVRSAQRVSNASSSIANPRKGVLQLTALRGVAAARPAACPSDPGDVASIRADLPLATGPLDAADVFDTGISRFFVRGDTTQVTTLEGPVEGRVTERVRWTLTFNRR